MPKNNCYIKLDEKRLQKIRADSSRQILKEIRDAINKGEQMVKDHDKSFRSMLL